MSQRLSDVVAGFCTCVIDYSELCALRHSLRTDEILDVGMIVAHTAVIGCHSWRSSSRRSLTRSKFLLEVLAATTLRHLACCGLLFQGGEGVTHP